MAEPRVVSPRVRRREPLPLGRAAVPLAALVLGLLAGVVLGGGGGAPAAGSLPEGSPTHYEAGIPRGFAADEDGAVAAAHAWVRAQGGEFVISPERSEQVIAALTGGDFAAEAREDLVEWHADEDVHLLADLAERAGYGIYNVPLAHRVRSFGGGTASVLVWVVNVQVMGEKAPPQVGFFRERYELARERGEWRILGVEEIGDGPTPELLDQRPTGPARATRQLQGYVNVSG